MNGLGPAPPPPRSPWQRLYGAVLAARRRRLGRRAERLPATVVSIGNLAWGGGGKTPFVIAVADHLRAAGRRVAVLSRGYGRASRGALLVSGGRGPEVDVAAAGDEPYLLAEALEGVAVAVGERRFEAGRLALAELAEAPDLFLLDDGFAHVGLARDVDLLLFPAADPWAGGRLLPGGRLREPLAAAAAADALILTGAGAEHRGAGAGLASALAAHGVHAPGFASVTETGAPRTPTGAALAAGTRVLALAGVARPEPFFAALRSAEVELLATREYRDHHTYSRRNCAAIDRLARRLGAEAVVVTGKDRPKLAGRLATPLAVVEIRARPEPAFWSWLDARLVESGR